jgi:hypothetical protein
MLEVYDCDRKYESEEYFSAALKEGMVGGHTFRAIHIHSILSKILTVL